MAAKRGVRERSVARSLARFSDTQGIAEDAPDHEVIEAFCALGLLGRSSATKGTYRSVLRRDAGVALPAVRPRYRGAAAKAPYSSAERHELIAIARCQPKRWRGEAALTVLALGIGAGLRAGEIVGARGSDVRIVSGTVVVTVPTTSARRVVIEEPFGEIAADLAALRADDYLFHPGTATRSYPNFVNAIASTLVGDPGAPRLCVPRCRASYLCDQLAGGVALDVILRRAGIVEVESLLRYALYVHGAPKTKAALRQMLRATR